MLHLNIHTHVFLFLPKECMVDEDGKFTELAGPELRNLCAMTDGTNKGTLLVCEPQTTHSEWMYKCKVFLTSF